MDNLRMVCDFVSQKEFDKTTQDFLMIVITLLCNYQMKELAHLIDMQMKIEYPTNEHGTEYKRNDPGQP